MKNYSNAPGDRLKDYLQARITRDVRLDVAVARLSIFGLDAVDWLDAAAEARFLLPADGVLGLLGDAGDRLERSHLKHRRLAADLARRLPERVHVRRAPKGVPQGIIIVRDAAGRPLHAVVGSFELSMTGLGVAPGNPLTFIQAFDGEEAAGPAAWFDQQWAAQPEAPAAALALAAQLRALVAPRSPRDGYTLMLHHLLGSGEGGLDQGNRILTAPGL